MSQAETSPDQTTTWKYCFDLLRCRIRCDIIILGHLAQQQIADAAPDNISFITLFLQATNNLSGVWAKLLNRDTMLRDWNNDVICDDYFLKTFKYCRSNTLVG